MTLTNPVVAYTAANNVEAHMLSALLDDAGIPAVAVDDVSQVGVWIGGLASQVHKPQVWVEKVELERARAVLLDYERRNADRRALEALRVGYGALLDVTCDACGRQLQFPAEKKGTIQSCPHCEAFVDVEVDFSSAGWEDEAQQ